MRSSSTRRAPSPRACSRSLLSFFSPKAPRRPKKARRRPTRLSHTRYRPVTYPLHTRYIPATYPQTGRRRPTRPRSHGPPPRARCLQSAPRPSADRYVADVTHVTSSAVSLCGCACLCYVRHARCACCGRHVRHIGHVRHVRHVRDVRRLLICTAYSVRDARDARDARYVRYVRYRSIRSAAPSAATRSSSASVRRSRPCSQRSPAMASSARLRGGRCPEL